MPHILPILSHILPNFDLILVAYGSYFGSILVAHEQNQSHPMNHTGCYSNPTKIIDLFNLQKQFELHVCVCVCVCEQM